MRTRVEDKDKAIVAARAILSDVESVNDAEMLHAIGFAGLFASAKGMEVEIIVGMKNAAKDAGELILAEILEAAIEEIRRKV